MHDHAGCFVDDEQMGVFEADIEWDVLRLDRDRWHRQRKLKADVIATPDPVAGPSRSAVDADGLFIDQGLNATAGKLWALADEEPVQSLCLVVFSDPDLDRLGQSMAFRMINCPRGSSLLWGAMPVITQRQQCNADRYERICNVENRPAPALAHPDIKEIDDTGIVDQPIDDVSERSTKHHHQGQLRQTGVGRQRPEQPNQQPEGDNGYDGVNVKIAEIETEGGPGVVDVRQPEVLGVSRPWTMRSQELDDEVFRCLVQ